jgi:hypothetical protein
LTANAVVIGGLALAIHLRPKWPTVVDDHLTLALATLASYCIASLTWFFSSRPRLFVRVFVPADELRYAVRGILRDPGFGRSMRIIAAVQATAATLVGLFAAWHWFADA